MWDGTEACLGDRYKMFASGLSWLIHIRSVSTNRGAPQVVLLTATVLRSIYEALREGKTW